MHYFSDRDGVQVSNDEILAALEQINARINREPYKYDPPEKDDWRPDAAQDGKDCDSYAVAKGRAVWAWASLHVPGWSIENHRLACLWVSPSKAEGTYHCVQIIRLDDGSDWCLDNCQYKVFSVMDMDRMGYVTDRIQATGGQMKWVEWLGNKEVA